MLRRTNSVGRFHWVLPHIYFTKENSVIKKENVVGPYAMIHHILAQKTNFSIQFVEPLDNAYGVRLPNGTWTGLIGMLLNDEIDLIANPMVLSQNRLGITKFTSPLSIQNVRVLAGNSPNEAISIFGYLGVFTLNLWIVVLLTMIFLATISSVFDGLLNPKPKSLWFRLLSSFSNYFGALFLEASARDIRHNAGRLLFAFWWLGILVLMNAFQGHFKSSMMLKTDSDRIDTIKDVVNKPNLRPLIFKNSAYDDLFKHSTNPDIKTIYKRATQIKGLQFTEGIFSSKTIEEVHRGKSVIMHEVVITKTYVSLHCQPQIGSLYFSRELIFPHYLGIVTRRGLPDSVYNKIEDVIYRVKESGLFDKWMNEMMRDWTKCTRGHDDGRSERSLKLKDLSAVFIFLVMSMGLAGVSLLSEICFNRRKRN